MNQSAGGATLVLRRGKGYVDKVRAYKVLLDGQEVGRIKQNEEHDFGITPGRHQLQVQIDWATSPIEAFEVAAGQSVVYTCRPNATPWNALIYMTFKRKKYLALERAQ